MKRIRDPLYGLISIDDDLIKSPYFQRLRYIIQNGMAYMVFPSMNHTRFEHSIGAYHLLVRMKDKIDKVFETEKNDLSLDWETLEKLVLYHDIGHLPFSHTFEKAFEILKYLDKYLNNNSNKYQQINSFIKKEIGITKRSEKIHDYIGIVVLRYMNEDEVADLKKEVYVDPKSKDSKLARLIINSDLDVDRLDYLQRDAYFAGAKFGLIDVDRLREFEIEYISALDGCKPERYFYVFQPKSIDDLEHYFLARFHMYSSVYEHPVVSIYNGIMAYFIAYAIYKDLIDFENITKPEKFLYFTDDSVLHLLKNKKDDPEFKHFYEAIIERKKYKKAIIYSDKIAKNFSKNFKNYKDKIYNFLIKHGGKVIITDEYVKSDIKNILIHVGDEYKPAKDSLKVPHSRYKICVGVYNDENLIREVKEYFEDEFKIKLEFRNT